MSGVWFGGRPSFQVTVDPVTPTAFAISVAEDVRQAIGFAEAALAGRARFDPAYSARDIRICMGDMGEIRILPRLLAAFRKVAPRCRIFVLDLWGEKDFTEAFRATAQASLRSTSVSPSRFCPM